jgi:hypothetical protein
MTQEPLYIATLVGNELVIQSTDWPQPGNLIVSGNELVPYVESMFYQPYCLVARQYAIEPTSVESVISYMTKHNLTACRVFVSITDTDLLYIEVDAENATSNLAFLRTELAMLNYSELTGNAVAIANAVNNACSVIANNSDIVANYDISTTNIDAKAFWLTQSNIDDIRFCISTSNATEENKQQLLNLFA